MSKEIEMFSPQKNIDDMNYDELRAFVKKFYNLFERFKREYIDTLENLDETNFSGHFLKEQNGMKAKIVATAEKIESTVSKVDLEKSLEAYTKITQTADAISMLASKGADISEAEEIRDYDTLCLEGNTYHVYVIREKDEDGNVIKETYYYHNDLSKKWEAFSGDSIYTVFEQTPEGFNLKGNVVIDGNTVVTKNLVLSGNVTWDMDNSPVKTQYSADNESWHEEIKDGDLYMRMSFDGGNTWSTATKVVGTDGKNGTNGSSGSDASVTPENVFAALTDDGARQGIFAAFVNKENQIYINAEFLASKIAEVANTLYIGDIKDDEPKSICFKDAAKISTYNDGSFAGLQVSATTFKIANGILDLSDCTDITWGDNAPVAIFGGD